jgi:hypothetical protein
VKRLIERSWTPRRANDDDDAVKPWRAGALSRRLLALFWAAAVAITTLGWLYLIYRIVWFLTGRVIA